MNSNKAFIKTDTNRASMLKRLLPFGFFMPAFLFVAMVSFLPLLYALTQSFRASDNMGMGAFIGLGNYIRFIEESKGLEALWQSFSFVAGTVALAVPLGFALACALNRPLRFRNVFRTVLILPWLISNLVVALLWAWLLNGNFSPLAQMLAVVGVNLPNATTSSSLAMPALIMANVWHSYPLVMIFVLAALQTVPAELYEAARIDGAGPWQRFRLITLPLVKNTTIVVLVLTTLHSFNNVTMVFIMTGGGPVGATETLALRVFLEEFKYFHTGIAAAAAVVIFSLNMLFSLAYIRVLRIEKTNEN
jgi:multiple sugar transport system permease protein